MNKGGLLQNNTLALIIDMLEHDVTVRRWCFSCCDLGTDNALVIFSSSTSSECIITSSYQHQAVIPRLYYCCKKSDDNSEQILHIPARLQSKEDFPRVSPSKCPLENYTLIIFAE